MYQAVQINRSQLHAVLIAGLASLASAPAVAATITYQCTGYRMLTGEFTPRGAQIHFEGKDYTLSRVRDAREATFVDGRHGVTIVTRQRDLSLHLPTEALACKLQSDALQDLRKASGPTTGASGAAK
jgi:hypothetical protein